MNTLNKYKDLLFFKITEDFKNETDYTDSTAKVFYAYDIISNASLRTIGRILEITPLNKKNLQIILRIKKEFLEGCDKYLKS